LQYAAVLRPESLQAEDQLLEAQRILRGSQGFVRRGARAQILLEL
jgi:hypothetical protein